MIRKFNIFLNESIEDDSYTLTEIIDKQGSSKKCLDFLIDTFVGKLVSFEYFHPMTKQSTETGGVIEDIFIGRGSVFFLCNGRYCDINPNEKIIILKKEKSQDTFGED